MSPIEEKLAAIVHASWTGWMKHMTRHLVPGSGRQARDGTYLIQGWLPVGLRDRWLRQMGTLYADLPESEKESDRVEARKYLAVLAEEMDALRGEVLKANERTRATVAASQESADEAAAAWKEVADAKAEVTRLTRALENAEAARQQGWDSYNAMCFPWVVMWEGEPRSVHVSVQEAVIAMGKLEKAYAEKFKTIPAPPHRVVKVEES